MRGRAFARQIRDVRASRRLNQPACGHVLGSKWRPVQAGTGDYSLFRDSHPGKLAFGGHGGRCGLQRAWREQNLHKDHPSSSPYGARRRKRK